MQKRNPSQRLSNAFIGHTQHFERTCKAEESARVETWSNQFEKFHDDNPSCPATTAFSFNDDGKTIKCPMRKQFLPRTLIFSSSANSRIEDLQFPVHLADFEEDLDAEYHCDRDKEYDWNGQFNQELQKVSGMPSYTFEQWASDYKNNIAHLVQEHEGSLEQVNWRTFGANGIGYEKFAARYYDQYEYCPHKSDCEHLEYQESRDLTQDLLFYEALSQKDPYDAKVLEWLGKINAKLLNDEKSIAAFYRAVQNGSLEAFLNLCPVLLNQNCLGDFFDALLSYLQKHTVYSSVPLSSSKMEYLRLDNNFNNFPDERYWVLLHALLECVKINPTDPSLQRAMGFLFHASKDYRKALECFESCINLSITDSDPTDVLNMIAVTYEALEEHLKARQICQQILHIQPDHLRAMYNLAISVYKAGQRNEAAALLIHALKINPWSKEIRDTLDVISHEFGDA